METIKAVSFIETPDVAKVRADIEQQPKEFVKGKLTGSKFDFGVQNIISDGIYREMGFLYNLRPFLRKFVYKKYGQWSEVWALNKTNARKLVGGYISEIIEA